MLKNKGYTIVELLITMCILTLLLSQTLPDLNSFIVKIRVDNQISELHRLLLLSRNTAINYEKKVTLCPLDQFNTCTANWQGPLTLFIDHNNNKKLEPRANEAIIAIKSGIQTNDSLVYGAKRDSIIYSPEGNLSGLSNGTFKYCPDGYQSLSRGLIVATSGRIYTTQNNNKDNIDKNRANKAIVCI